METGTGRVITRFAPSPTGHLHIGGARTALFCWAFARHARRGGLDGRFMIRIEDTDQARSSDESTRGILRDLAWLGIDWDEGPALAAGGRTIGGDPRGVGSFFQSDRTRAGVYDRWVDWLVERELAYPAFETAAELEAKRRAASLAKRTYRYDRAGLAVPADQRRARMKAGEPHVVRFRLPDEPVRVIDRVLGEVAFDDSTLDDFVIRKADGFPTYHFAVVVDDELMGVTHVLRGQEHLNNTPRHVALQRAMRHDDGRPFRTPEYAHMPLIFNMEGQKMSKRERDRAARDACKKLGLDGAALHAALPGGPGTPDAAALAGWLADPKTQLEAGALELVAAAVKITLPEVTVDDFRRAGYLPEVITNFIALLGWSPGGDVEKFDTAYLAEKFELARIGKTNARFDRVKLLAFNSDAVTTMDSVAFASRWRAWCADHEPGLATLPPAVFDPLAEAIRPRCKTLRDAADQARFVLADDDAVGYDAKAVEKVLRAQKPGEPGGLAILSELCDVLEAAPGFSAAEVHAALGSFAAARGLGLGRVAQPLRVALTGTTVSPPIDATAAALGRDRTLARVKRCLAVHG